MNMKRILAFCLTLTLLFGLLPMSAAAEETQAATTAATTEATESTGGNTHTDEDNTDEKTGGGLLSGLMSFFSSGEEENTDTTETAGSTESTGGDGSGDSSSQGEADAGELCTTCSQNPCVCCAVCQQYPNHAEGCGNNPAPIDTGSTDPVWVYKPGETTPFITYATIAAAVSYVNSLKKNDYVIELHGDTIETKAIQPTYSMTIRSEAGADHTVSFSDLSSNYGVRLSTASKTLTLGGGAGYGTLTLDMANQYYGIYISNGTVIIQDGLTIRNGASDIAGGAVRMNADDTKPVLRINGGTFENNTAKAGSQNESGCGGAIAVMKGVAHISGGTFTGNSAAEFGNAVYCRAGTDVHIQGNPVFGEDQDIYIVNTSDTDDNALIKDGPIISGKIPVTLGNDADDLYELRDVLVSGEAEVTEADLPIFTITNTEDLAVMYRRLGFTAADSATGKPVLELVPDFLSNFDNFIDDEFTPAPFGDTQGKTAHWLNSDKTQAEIIIDESSTEKDVLIIGSLCGAHGLKSDCMKTVINTAAKYNNVTYHFESQTAGGPSQFSQDIAGIVRGPVKGTLAKGKVRKADIELYSGAHDSTGQLATALAGYLQEKQYNQVILIFDNCSVSTMSYDALTIEEQKACYQAANLLAPYYESGRIAWVSSGTNVMYRNFEMLTTYRSGVDFEIDSLLMQGSYSTDTSLYHYDTSHVKNDDTIIGKYDKFNVFFSMALFDPVTWLKGIEEKRIPEWSEYTINTNGVLYNNVDDVENYIGSKFIRDEIVIKDEVDPALPINSVYLERSEDDGKTWKDISNDGNVTITRDGQNVTASISGIGPEDTKLRLRIVCDCPGEFKVGDNQEKDTNIGYAEVIYKASGEEKITYDLVSPRLLKWFPPAYIVFEENGGSTVNDMEGVSSQKIENRTMPFTYRTGYEFKGWYASADFAGGRVTQLPEAYPPGTTTYYARWVDNTGELVTDKSADAQKDGTYKITLESYATGQTILTQDMVVKPTDISLVLDYSASMTYCLDADCNNGFLPQTEDAENRLYNVRYNGTSDEMFMIHTQEQRNDYISVDRVKENMGTVTEYYARFKELDLTNKLGGVYRKVYYCAQCSESAIAANGTNANRGRWHWEKNPSDHSYQVVPFTTYNGGPTEDGLDYCPFFDLSIKEHACRTRHQMQYEALHTFMAAIVDSAKTQNVDHRVSIVRFSTTTSTKLSMTSVLDGNNLAPAIANALEEYDFNDGTATGSGLELGVQQLSKDDTRSQLMVLLTDGVPTSPGTNVPMSLEATYDAIHNYNAKVYTIGIFKDADASNKGTITRYHESFFNSSLSTQNQIDAANSFMKLLSSNYPNISKVDQWETATLDPDLPADKNYYLAAKDANELKNAFTLIAGDISSTTSTITLGKNTVVRDIVTRYFDVVPGADITAYTMTYGGKDANNEEIWTEEPDDTASRSTLKVKSGETSSGNLTITMAENTGKSTTTIQVTNFDFGENYVGMDRAVDGTETPHGKKLVIEILVQAKDGFLGGNHVPTNEAESGIYDKDGELQKEFPEPDVDVPIPNLTVAPLDKHVYLLGDLTQEQLKDGMTASYGTGTNQFNLDLTIGAPGYGVDEWKQKFVDIGIGCDGPFTKLEADQTYRVTLTVTPKDTTGDVTRKTGTGSGKIYVYKPTLTYKDSDVFYGESVPTYFSGNLESTVWKHGDTLDTEVTMIGTAPSLTPACTLVNASDVKDGKINTKLDVPVDVTSVMIDTTEVLSHTTFQHMDCEKNEDLKGGHFLLHPQTCSLTITKVGGDAGDPYTFTVMKDGENYSDATITADEDGSGSVTIYELPVGTYTIQEDTKWSWRFDPAYSGNCALSNTNPSGTITCTNTRIPEKYQWFNGYSEVVPNTYGKKQ